MSQDKENEAIMILRNLSGGLGNSLSDQQKRAIITGIKNKPENVEPFDGKKFDDGLAKATTNNPLSWVEF